MSYPQLLVRDIYSHKYVTKYGQMSMEYTTWRRNLYLMQEV